MEAPQRGDVQAVEVSGLTHRFPARGHDPGRTALTEVTFTVETGSFFGLLGPNGGGKTTLFRVLSTLLAPSEGRAAIFGLDPVEQSAAVRTFLGVVFQAPALDKKLTVRENLRHAGHLQGLAGAPLEARIDEMLARLGVADRAGDLVEVLSGGLARRVDIARALLHRPRLLLLDEPSTGLDPAARHQLRTHLTELARADGVTVLLTTHFMEEAERCDRLGILHQGKLVALGTPDELKAKVGGDVVTLGVDDPGAMGLELEERLAVKPRQVAGKLRLEHPEGASLLGRILELGPGRFRSVTLSKPTLEDVFLQITGVEFREVET